MDPTVHVVNRKTMRATSYNGYYQLFPALHAKQLKPEWLESETEEGVRTYRVQCDGDESYRLVIHRDNIRVRYMDLMPRLGGF